MRIRLPRPVLTCVSAVLIALVSLAAPTGAARAQQNPALTQPESTAANLPTAPAQESATEPTQEAPRTGFLGAMDSFERNVDAAMGRVDGVVAAVFFFDVLFWDDQREIPLVVLWLVMGAIFFTIYLRFVNIRGFGHAIRVTRGAYDNPHDTGEVSHFKALTAALSATVGLGNIAGVAIAVSVGGPGATFWMIIAGLLGMSSKFAECTLGQQYREVRPDRSEERRV